MCKRLRVNRTVGEFGWKQHKEPGMFPITVAWSAKDKRGPHSAGLQPNEKNEPIIQQLGSPCSLLLMLLVSKRAVRLPRTRLITFSLQCCSHQTWIPIVFAIVQCRTTRSPTQVTATLQNPQCNSWSA